MSTFNLSIHGAPRAVTGNRDGNSWVWLYVGASDFVADCVLHLRGPDAEHHAAAIAKAFNDAHAAENAVLAPVAEVQT